MKRRSEELKSAGQNKDGSASVRGELEVYTGLVVSENHIICTLGIRASCARGPHPLAFPVAIVGISAPLLEWQTQKQGMRVEFVCFY